MPLPLVLQSHPLPKDWVQALEGRACVLVGLEAAEDALGEVEGLLSLLTLPVNAALLDRMPKLRVVSNMAVGVDNVDRSACAARGIPVGHTPGVLTAATADLTFALLLAAARNLPAARRDAQEGRWSTWSPTGWLGADLEEATLGIIGLGAIGQAVARRARGFGMSVVYTAPRAKPEAEAQLDVRRVELAELLQTADFVSLHCPLNDATHHLIDADALARMKPNAILVNAARGPVVDQEALLAALRGGEIAGAALDVTTPEPLEPEHPLFSEPRCLILPHIGSATFGTRRAMAELAVENLLAGLEGRPLPREVR